jgi:hypothetical protein
MCLVLFWITRCSSRMGEHAELNPMFSRDAPMMSRCYFADVPSTVNHFKGVAMRDCTFVGVSAPDGEITNLGGNRVGTSMVINSVAWTRVMDRLLYSRAASRRCLRSEGDAHECPNAGDTTMAGQWR